MSGVVLILEDNTERAERFERVVREIMPGVRVVRWSSAKEMIREAGALMEEALVVSLDHDLYPPSGSDEDWGDGLEAAKFLVGQSVKCPVIVHSSNADRAQMMVGEFELAGWEYKVVLPFGKDWVEADWRRAVQELL